MPRTVVGGVTDYERIDRGVRFDCSLERDERETLAAQQGDEIRVDRTVPVVLQFYDPSTFRFELQANPEAETDGSLVETDPEAIKSPVAVETTEHDGTLVVETDALTVAVGLEKWTFDVSDGDRSLLSEQRDDRNAKGNRRVQPLGFREEEVTNWPYRVSRTETAFELAADESFFGLGEQFTCFDKRGQSVSAWTTQPNGSETEDAYKNVPFYLSSRGYGLLVDTTERVEFDLGDASVLSGQVSVRDDALSLVFFYGPKFEEILRTYTALTGRPRRPPKWSFGVWMSRYGYQSREELEAVTDRLREEDIPCDVVHLDPYWMRERHECDLEWDRDAFPDPEEMIEALHDDGFRLSLWEHPYLTVGTDAFEHAKANGYLVTDPTGDPYVLDRLSISTYRAGIVDFTDPEAVEWWKEKHRSLVEIGVDVFKTDFGEYLPEDAVFENGRTGKSMRNVYPHLYQRAVHESMAEAAGPENAMLFARSGWIGSQQFPVHWPGDPQCTFGSMAACLRGGLSLALSGYQFWAHDVGGFKGEPSEELYVRWAQFGMLSSHTRFHGTTPREPWEFGDRATEIVTRFAKLKYRLLPYIYSCADRASDTGLPVMRPLVLAYQDDPAVYDLGDQYLLGPALLVAPVFDTDGRVTVYLPEGEWIDFFSDDRYEGGQTLTRQVPLSEVPLYLKAGSIVPMRKEATQTVQEGTPNRLILWSALRRDEPTAATFPFYDEDADTTREFGLEADTAGSTIRIAVPDGISCRARLHAGPDAPDSVCVNGSGLDRTAAEPDDGEWTYDEETRIVVAELQ